MSIANRHSHIDATIQTRAANECQSRAADVARFVVADPGLVGAGGHHLGYSQAIAEAAAVRGMPALILANRACAVPVMHDGVRCIATFDAEYRTGRRLGPLRRMAYTGASFLPAPTARALADMLRGGRRALRQVGNTRDRLGWELGDALLSEGGDGNDLVLLHTVSAANLHSVTLGLPRDAVRRLAVVLRRTPDEMEATDAAPVPVKDVLQALIARFGDRLRLLADTEALAALYRDLLHHPMRSVPIPVTLQPGPARHGAIDRPHVIFAGGARSEKGYDLLPDLVAALKGRARFTIHSGTVDGASDPVVQQAHRRLRRLAGPDVVLLTRPLEPDDYAEVLRSADLVLLPYDAEAYGPRSSGILAEARALGIPAIVPAGTWMADVAGPATDVVFSQPAALLATVERALGRLAELTAAWRAAAPAWRHSHSPQALLDALLAE